MKKILYNLFHYSGFNYLCSHLMDRKLFLVMYHSVSKEVSSGKSYRYLYPHISVNLTDFEKQITYLLKMGHTFISFKDIPSLKSRGTKKPTIVYFDDGFKDVMEDAVPVLKKYGIPATFFVVTGILDRSHLLWTILYREHLTGQGLTEAEQNRIIHDVKTGTEAERERMMQKYSLADHQYLFDVFMTWDDIRKLSADGFEIGSHGHSHSRLTECPPSELAREIAYSKERIESETGSKVEAFSFPHGRGDDRIISELEKCGYKYAVSKGKGVNSLADLTGNVLYLRNISPKPKDSLRTFKLRMYSLNIKK